MPRTRRTSLGGFCYHVINRGNQKSVVFHDEADYLAFMYLLTRAGERVPMRVLAWCLMPNHFHLVLWPRGDGDLSRWMHWLLSSHVRRHHRRYGSSGRVWQGRFKAFPIQQDHHLLTVLRYVERNPLRAGLVSSAEDWPWSSLRLWSQERPSLLTPGPVDRFVEWARYVDEPQTEDELAALRNSTNRQSPFGEDEWRRTAATRLDLEWTLRPRGRPRDEQTETPRPGS
jgi:putative transposase